MMFGVRYSVVWCMIQWCLLYDTVMFGVWCSEVWSVRHWCLVYDAAMFGVWCSDEWYNVCGVWCSGGLCMIRWCLVPCGLLYRKVVFGVLWFTIHWIPPVWDLRKFGTPLHEIQSMPFWDEKTNISFSPNQQMMVVPCSLRLSKDKASSRLEVGNVWCMIQWCLVYDTVMFVYDTVMFVAWYSDVWCMIQ